MKTIKICGKEYPIDCNAYTRFQYKKIFGQGIFSDIKKLNEFSEKQESLKEEMKSKGISEEEIEKQINLVMMENLDDFIDVIERIAYILIYTANNKVESFDEWLKSLPKIELSADWIGEVTELAVDSFC